MTKPIHTPWKVSPAHLRAVVIGVIGIAVALLFRVPSLLVMTTPFALVAVWAAATRPVADPTLVGRVAPSSVREGEATSWTGELSNIDGVDHVVVFAPEQKWLETRPRSGVVSAAVGHDDSSVALEIPMRATHWGRHGVGPISVVGISSWGAFRWKALDSGFQVTALPLPSSFDAAAPMHRANGLVGLNRSAHPGDGSEFAGIRPFQTGDRLRRINWARSLRSDELHVTATYADQDTHVALFVDALADFGESGGVDGAASSLDTTVRAAGAIAEHFLLRGDRVSLRVLDDRFQSTVPPASGRRHLRRILDVLASIEHNITGRGLARNTNSAVPSGAMVIMLSPLISPAALQRAISIASHGLSVAVIDTLPDDVHADDDPTTELAWRIRLLERHREVRAVQRVGVPVIPWQGPGSLDPFLREIARRANGAEDGASMKQSVLQQWIDEIVESSRQQWLLRLGVVVAAMMAVVATSAANDQIWPLGMFAVLFLAMASAMRPDTQIASTVVVVVIWRWLATVDEIDTPWLPITASCLLAFHALTALSSSVPTGGTLPSATMIRWIQQTSMGGCATFGVWLLVVLFDRREAAGNGFLTGAALAIVAGAAAIIRSLSINNPRQP